MLKFASQRQLNNVRKAPVPAAWSELPGSLARYRSPLRYPGGKSALASFVQSIFVANEMVGGVYAEPYAGGASVALDLLFGNYARTIYINDADPAVHAFWCSVLSHTADLCRMIRNTKATVSEWHRQRATYLLGKRSSTLELGFATFFLNRTNRSGIIGSAGVIGGLEQDGRWKIDARYNANELAARIERIADLKGRIVVSGMDAALFLSRTSRHLQPNSLVYMDPPYYVKGERRLYANYYERSDHSAIAKAASGLRCHWLVSYDQAPEIRTLYRSFRSLSYSLRYSASTTATGREVMFFSDRLNVPRQHRPPPLLY
jgi:DNA adenine methylase